MTTNEQAELLNQKVQILIEKHAPRRRIRIRQNRCSIISEATKAIMKERDAARRQIRKLQSPNERKTAHEKFKRLRNRTVTSLRNDKKEQVERDIANGKNPWHIANSILKKQRDHNISLVVNGKEIISDKEKCEIMNNFFINKIKNLQSRINANDTPALLTKLEEKYRNKNLNFTFRELSVREIEKILRRMKKSKSSGIDGISTELIRPITKIIAPALTTLVNHSLMDGIFPDIYKCARITCIYKGKGSKSDMSNYRPISNLQVFGKVQEIAADLQLRKFCETNGLFGTHQHGFRSSRSTATALLTASVRWRMKKDKRKHQGVLLFDLSAAYDMLNRDLFLKKAQICGIGGSAIKWLQSYLTGRSQAVSIGEEQSTVLPLSDGTPQGSSISCTLFALFVGDLGLWAGGSSLTMYADDTCATVEADNLNELMEKLQTIGEKVLWYFANNKMVTNPEKTGLMILRPTLATINEEVSLRLAESEINESKEHKILGVIVQNDFKFTKHTKKVKGDLQHALSVLSRLRKSLGRKELTQIANGIFMHRQLENQVVYDLCHAYDIVYQCMHRTTYAPVSRTLTQL